MMAGVLFDREVPEGSAETWTKLLSRFSVEKVEVAMQKALQSCKRFPVPADVISQLALPDSVIEEERAENSWQAALEWARENGNLPDGAKPRTPLDRRSAHALRVAGGANYVESCSKDDLVWARKRYLEAYTRYLQVECADLDALPEDIRAEIGRLGRDKELQ